MRWLSGAYEFTGLTVVGAKASLKLNLNELIAGSGITADKGSIELNYVGEAGAVTAMNHITGVMQYDVAFKDTETYGSGMLTVPYFMISAHDETKVWLQNTTPDAVTVTMKYYMRLYIHNNATAQRHIEVVKEYEGYSETVPYTFNPHVTKVIELEKSDMVPPLFEAGFEVEQVDGEEGEIIVSASVINMKKEARFQVPVVSSYCGGASKLESRGGVPAYSQITRYLLYRATSFSHISCCCPLIHSYQSPFTPFNYY